jgi:hypothetical protein
MSWLRSPSSGTITRGGESAGAVFDESRTYRYLLWRRWRALTEGPVLLFVMLNPSTADEQREDPTIRSCIRAAQRRRAAAMITVNLYALRATDPRRLREHADPIGAANDAHLALAAAAADLIIVAWGNSGPAGLDARATAVCEGPLAGRRLTCLGVTKAGRPRHPLYLPASARLRTYAPGKAMARDHRCTVRAKASGLSGTPARSSTMRRA